MKEEETKHPGSSKMYQDLKPLFWWTKVKKEIAPFVARCDNCCRVKTVHMKAYLLQDLSIPGWKWEDVSMDFIVGLPTSVKGYDSIWVIVDRLTKVARFIPDRTDYRPHQYAELYSRTLFVSMVCLKLSSQTVDHSSLPVFGSVFMSRLVLTWFVVLLIIPKRPAKLNVLTKS